MSFRDNVLSSMLQIPFLNRLTVGWLMTSANDFGRLYERATHPGVLTQLRLLAEECRIRNFYLDDNIEVVTTPAIFIRAQIGTNKKFAEPAIKLQILNTTRREQHLCIFVTNRKQDPFILVFDSLTQPAKVVPAPFLSTDEVLYWPITVYEGTELEKALELMRLQLAGPFRPFVNAS